MESSNVCELCQNERSQILELPCSHLFCTSCLRDYIVSRRYEFDGSFLCPTCKMKTLLPERSNDDRNQSVETLTQDVGNVSIANVASDGSSSAMVRMNDTQPGYSPQKLVPMSHVNNLSQSPTKTNMTPRSLYPNLDSVSSPYSATPLSPEERNTMKASLPIKYDSYGAVYAFGRYGDELVDFKDPVSMAVSSSGHVFVTDRSKNRVLIFSRSGKISRLFTTDGVVGCVAIDNNNGLLVSEAEAGRGLVYRYDSDCQKKGSIGSMFSFEKSHGLAFDAANSHIVVSTLETNMIYTFDLAGKLVSKFGGRGKGNQRFMNPLYLGANQSGQLLVVDSDDHCIKVYNSARKYLHQIGSSGSGAGQLENPQGICLDRWDNVIVCDYGNARLQLFDKHGKFLVEMTRFAPGYHPKDVAYESHSNKLYILLSGHRKAELRIADYYVNNPAKGTSSARGQC